MAAPERSCPLNLYIFDDSIVALKLKFFWTFQTFYWFLIRFLRQYGRFQWFCQKTIKMLERFKKINKRSIKQLKGSKKSKKSKVLEIYARPALDPQTDVFLNLSAVLLIWDRFFETVWSFLMILSKNCQNDWKVQKINKKSIKYKKSKNLKN